MVQDSIKGREDSADQLGEAAYLLPAEELLSQLDSDPHRGLTGPEAERRGERFGPNQLTESGRRPLYHLVLHQLRDRLILVLFIAAGLAWYLGDNRGATVLLLIILVNAAIGLYQEYHAEALLERLRSMVRTMVATHLQAMPKRPSNTCKPPSIGIPTRFPMMTGAKFHASKKS